MRLEMGEGCAVKEAESDADRLELGREARALRACAHPGVVAFLGSDGGDPPRRLVVGHPAGGTWDGAQPVPVAVLTGRAAAIASTLADLHELGWAHGALAPEVVLLDEGGRPVLSGFTRAVGPGRPEELRQAAMADVTSLAAMTLDRLPPGADRKLTRLLRATAGVGRPARPLPARQLARRLVDLVPGATLQAGPCSSSGDVPAVPDPVTGGMGGGVVPPDPAPVPGGPAGGDGTSGDPAVHGPTADPAGQPGVSQVRQVRQLSRVRRVRQLSRGRRGRRWVPGSAGATGAARRPFIRRRAHILVAAGLSGGGVLLACYWGLQPGRPGVADGSPPAAAGDVGGRGLTVPAQVPPAQVPPAGVVLAAGDRYMLAGRPGTRLLTVEGRWGCGPARPAALDAVSGWVWVFARWPAAGASVQATPVTRVPGAVGLAVRATGAGCDGLTVLDRSGRMVAVPGPAPASVRARRSR